jgi:hypothetical protein
MQLSNSSLIDRAGRRRDRPTAVGRSGAVDNEDAENSAEDHDGDDRR